MFPLNRTYEQIVDEMLKAYFNESGQKPDKNSLEMKRIEAVASELYGLSCYGDFIFKQSFVQTATGEYLDRHGEIRDCARKEAFCATGWLDFYLDEPIEEDVEIPMGTICSVKDQPYLQFVTDEKGVITAGETSVSLVASAMYPGSDYNVKKGEVTVMVNAPVKVSGVVNKIRFEYGADAENDNVYRKRIMSNYNVAQNGVNTTSLENIVLDLDFIKDCYIPEAISPGYMNVAILTHDGYITTQERLLLEDSIGIHKITGAEFSLSMATPKNYSITVDIYIRAGFDHEEVKAKVEDIVKEVNESCRIGRSLSITLISKRLSLLEELTDFYLYCDEANGEIISCRYDEFLDLEELRVNCFE